MPYIYSYQEADGFRGDLILDAKTSLEEIKAERPDIVSLDLNEIQTARYNANLIALLLSRDQMALFRDA